MNIQNDALKQLEDLKVRHRKVDEHIQDLIRGFNNDQLQIRRLKKQKLQLKDEISRIKASLLPDIIA
ncbi:MAG TPA: DUF465 domain-containing protein [Rhodospirillales bacterium]|nr:DUF465 domain-containing protein [Rhodospirillales bacterium]